MSSYANAKNGVSEVPADATQNQPNAVNNGSQNYQHAYTQNQPNNGNQNYQHAYTQNQPNNGNQNYQQAYTQNQPNNGNQNYQQAYTQNQPNNGNQNYQQTYTQNQPNNGNQNYQQTYTQNQPNNGNQNYQQAYTQNQPNNGNQNYQQAYTQNQPDNGNQNYQQNTNVKNPKKFRRSAKNDENFNGYTEILGWINEIKVIDKHDKFSGAKIRSEIQIKFTGLLGFKEDPYHRNFIVKVKPFNNLDNTLWNFNDAINDKNQTVGATLRLSIENLAEVDGEIYEHATLMDIRYLSCNKKTIIKTQKQ